MEAIGILLAFLIYVVLPGWIIYYLMNRPSPECAERCQGHTDEEKEIIRYFLDTVNCVKSLPFTESDYDNKVNMSVPSSSVSMEHALEACNLDESQIEEVKPIHLCGYFFDTGCLAKRTAVKCQSSKYQHTWLFFTKDQLHVYQYVRNMECTSGSENTLELFYKDITSFSTSTESTTKTKQSKRNFGVTSINFEVESEIFKIVVPGDSIKCAMEGSEDIKASVRAMNSLLREKKNA